MDLQQFRERRLRTKRPLLRAMQANPVSVSSGSATLGGGGMGGGMGQGSQQHGQFQRVFFNNWNSWNPWWWGYGCNPWTGYGCASWGWPMGYGFSSPWYQPPYYFPAFPQTYAYGAYNWRPPYYAAPVVAIS